MEICQYGDSFKLMNKNKFICYIANESKGQWPAAPGSD